MIPLRIAGVIALTIAAEASVGARKPAAPEPAASAPGLRDRLRATGFRIERAALRWRAALEERGPRRDVKAWTQELDAQHLGVAPAGGVTVVARGPRAAAIRAGLAEMKALSGGAPGSRAAVRRAQVFRELKREARLTRRLKQGKLGVSIRARGSIEERIVVSTAPDRTERFSTLAHERQHIGDFAEMQTMFDAWERGAALGTPQGARLQRRAMARFERDFGGPASLELRAEVTAGVALGLTGRSHGNPQENLQVVGQEDVYPITPIVAARVDGYVVGARERMLADPRVASLGPAARGRLERHLDRYLGAYQGALMARHAELTAHVATAPPSAPRPTGLLGRARERVALARWTHRTRRAIDAHRARAATEHVPASGLPEVAATDAALELNPVHRLPALLAAVR